MTYGEYVMENPDYESDFCTLYKDDSGKNCFVEERGEITAIMLDGKDLLEEDDFYARKSSAMEQLSSIVNGEHGDYYKGWTPVQLAKISMTVSPCSECPWRATCDLMHEEIDF